jgi:hypothetical protein
LFGHGSEPAIQSSQGARREYRRGQQVCVDPPNALAKEPVTLNKLKDPCVRGWGGSPKPAKRMQRLSSLGKITTGEFANHKRMDANPPLLQQNQEVRVGSPEVGDPY